MRVFVRDDTFVALSRALDAVSLRHEVIADNIANVNTPGFKAKSVEFETQLKAALARRDPAHIRPVIKEDPLPVRRDGNSVDIDLEMAKLAEATILYSALSRLISDRLALLRSVVSEGRR